MVYVWSIIAGNETIVVRRVAGGPLSLKRPPPPASGNDTLEYEGFVPPKF